MCTLSLLLLWLALLSMTEDFLNMVQNGIKWICLCVYVFPSVVVHVVFYCYRCWLDVLSVACNFSPCSGDLYFVWPVVVIVIALSSYCAIYCPPSPHWTATVDPMGIDTKTCEVSLFGSFLPCLYICFLWCSSSLSILTSFLSITGIIPCTRWLNSNIARHGRPCPSGVVLIWSNTMCTSPLKSEHFFIVHLMNFMQGLYLSIALVMVWWWHCLLNVENAAEASEFLWNKIAASIWHYLHGYHIMQIWLLLLWWDSLLITPPSSSLLGICCDILQYTNNFLLNWNMST